MGRRADWVHQYPGLWEFAPGGGVEPGIDPVDVLLSELAEETGCTCTGQPAAIALLLDEDGFVTEATTANLVIYTNTDGLLSPRRAKILPGISLSVVAELAGQLGIRIADRDLLPGEVAVADEVMLTGTTSCLLPVVRFNNSPVGTGTPGPVFQQLLSAWSQLVNVDIVAQAQRFSLR